MGPGIAPALTTPLPCLQQSGLLLQLQLQLLLLLLRAVLLLQLLRVGLLLAQDQVLQLSAGAFWQLQPADVAVLWPLCSAAWRLLFEHVACLQLLPA